ncbi:hypothetical protein JYT83_01265, partial [bacterium AH-315-F18]|nr:hypothetical protein [bacterium AH-315-F18]
MTPPCPRHLLILALLSLPSFTGGGCRPTGGRNGLSGLHAVRTSEEKIRAMLSTVTGKGTGPKLSLKRGTNQEFIPRQALVGHRLLLEGRVVHPGGETMVVTVNGAPVHVDAGGHFQKVVVLSPGMNTLSARAIDAGGRVALAHRSVIYGDFLPLDQPVPDGQQIRLRASGLARISTMLRDMVLNLDLGGKLQAHNPIYQTSGWKYIFPYRFQASAGRP